MTLLQQLATVLPQDQHFNVLYVKSEPKECNDIIKHNRSHSSFAKAKLTVKIKHFLLIVDTKTQVVLFGIEVYNYLSIGDENNTQHLFVSKIDTTGLINVKINISKIISIFLSHLITNIHTGPDLQLKYRIKKAPGDTSTSTTIKKINKLLNPNSAPYKTICLPNSFKTKISLFTKSSNQYFFPNSGKNEFKHLINGDELLNWWLKLLNGMIRDLDVSFSQKLLIPGAINYNKKYLFDNWKVGSIFEHSPDDLAIYNLPNFTDDPKTRFLEFLIVENRYRLSLSQFYEELGFRQEFRLGNVVGIIGCELENYQMPPSVTDDNTIELTNRQYKKLINLIKSEDFNIADDIKLLVAFKIPFFLSLCKKSFNYGAVVGQFVHEGSKKQNNVQVNNLTGLVKRRKKT